MQRRLIALGLVVGCCCSAAAQDDAPADSILGGPSVALDADTPTLVERDYEGKLRELDTRPEVAAIGLLGLTDAEREKIDALVLERAKLVDQIVFDNLELLTQVQTARSNAQSGERMGEDQRAIIGRFMEIVRPLREQEPLADRFAEALPESKREAYHAMVREWHEAQAGEPQTEAGGETRRARRGPVRSPEMAGIRIEMRAAYDRGVGDRTSRIESLIAALEPTPEQEGEIRRLVRAFGDANGRSPTQAQRAELFRQILATLEPEQRRAALERLRENR